MAVTLINKEAIPADLAPGTYCCQLDESSTLTDFRTRLILPVRVHVPGDCLIQMVKHEPEHDDSCCMNGIPPGKGPHPDCPGKAGAGK